MMLKNQVAVITGGANGIGAGIAKRFVEEGAKVAVCDIDAETGRKITEALRGNAKFYRMDVADEEEIKKAVDQIFSDYAKIDILINNAGITNDKLLLRMTKEDWERVIDINLTGTFLVTRAVIKYMIKQRYGRIVNIASIAGIIGNPGQANYSASKAGIIGFTKSCAKELASRSITVNAIAPGFIETSMTAVLPDEVKENYLKAIPMKRFGKVEDVAALALFLSSEQASYMTGQVICLDGGLVM
ncbi:MAG TPA: 3-oxoacyl-[acyl-carrier-protein] reductase [candidate division WOR-3 bacterium]|uniref:3-oxoacyl-[acyl-carrier-protein] reductase n=1 Tax=candidate division WOR-3 bacterium TaxID=2052148 RepID=A0A9C9ENX3_UNCW3|nr:3-oxoacyl-[acyl-carrier-protein] reductase [candidate division WOR-3 bacterium]